MKNPQRKYKTMNELLPIEVLPIIPSPLKIQGGKRKIIDWLRKEFPPHQKYIEPFVGSGTVAMNSTIQPMRLSDTNPAIISYLKYCQEFSETAGVKLLKKLKSWNSELVNGGKDFYYKFRTEYNREPTPERFLMINHLCFNGMIRFNKDGIFNVPYGQVKEITEARMLSWISRTMTMKERFALATIVKCPYSDTVDYARDYPDVFIYCDPPYAGREATYYNSWTELDEEKLAEALGSIKGKFAVSTWISAGNMGNPNLKKYWKQYNVSSRFHQYMVGPKGKNRPGVIEGLIKNY